MLYKTKFWTKPSFTGFMKDDFIERVAYPFWVLFHAFVWVIVRVVGKIFFSLEIKGEENLKLASPPLLVVANHGSIIDPPLLFAVLPPFSRFVPIRFAAWKGWYKRLFPLMLLTGQFPVERGVGIEKVLSVGKRILERGGVVGIFPEGKRRHKGRPRKGRRGPAWLALTTGCNILPVYIDGNIGLTLKEALARKRKITIVIGKPFFLGKKEARHKKELNEPATLIMEKVRVLESLVR